MQAKAYITTSWDDGNPLDFRIADLLARYGLRGTFYIPREASTGVMSERKVRELSQTFEIGAHTMRHVFLDTAADALARAEIHDSKAWVQEVTGNPCPMFCPPGGKFDATHLAMVKHAGFSALRSVELLSLDLPRRRDGLLVMPTTLQAHPHRRRRLRPQHRQAACLAESVALRSAWPHDAMGTTHAIAARCRPPSRRCLSSLGPFVGVRRERPVAAAG